MFTSMINRLQKLRYKISKRKIEFTRDANKVLSVVISRSERKSISVYTLYFYKPRCPPPEDINVSVSELRVVSRTSSKRPCKECLFEYSETSFSSHFVFTNIPFF